MTDKLGPKIPGTSMLITFERVARLGSMTHAARELGAPVSSISRCMSMLERQLSFRLFERTGGGMRLTEPAQRYYESVHAALGLLQSGAQSAAESAGNPYVNIACCHDASQLLIMPRYAALESLLAGDARVRLLTYQRYMHELKPVEVADIELHWRSEESGAPAEDEALVLKEQIQPVCSPDYLSDHARTVQGACAGWGGLRLLDLELPNRGWSGWNDWFSSRGYPEAAPRHEGYDSYAQVLEAAAAGRGVALGLKHFVEGYLDRYALVPLNDGFEPFGGRYVAVLTARGRGNPLARKCMEFFAHFD